MCRLGRLLSARWRPSRVSPPADLRLLDAVKRRDPKAVEGLLRQKADVNAAQPDGGTALAWAVHLGDRPDGGQCCWPPAPRSNAANEYGETPLTLACLNGDAALVEKLLKAGADAKAARWNGETALMIAAGVGSVDAVQAADRARRRRERGGIAQGPDRADVGRGRRPFRRRAVADRKGRRRQGRLEGRLHGAGLRRHARTMPHR